MTEPSERDRRTMEREGAKARLAGKVGDDGTRWGSVSGSRSMVSAPSTSRRRCSCGCKGRATRVGLGDGLALTEGCELSMRRWVRDGYGRPVPFESDKTASEEGS